MNMPGRDISAEERNTLLVVATLIAAVTFQAAVNPPGGVWQSEDDGPPGKSIFGSTGKAAYTVFIFTNTLAYASAFQVIFSLVIGCPFQTEVWIAIFSMSCTYGASIASVQPSKVVNAGFLFIAFLTPGILRLAREIIKAVGKVVAKDGSENPTKV